MPGSDSPDFHPTQLAVGAPGRAIHFVEPILGAYPKPPIGIVADGPDHVTRQSFGFGPAFPLLVSEPPRQSGAMEPDPDRTFTIMQDVGDRISGQTTGRIDDPPVVSLEQRQAGIHGHHELTTGRAIQRTVRNSMRSKFGVAGDKMIRTSRLLEQPLWTPDPQVSLSIGNNAAPVFRRKTATFADLNTVAGVKTAQISPTS